MAKAEGATQEKKKKDTGFAFRFPEVMDDPGKARIGRARLLERYETQVREALSKQFGYGNVMMIPSVDKVVLNMGLGAATRAPKLLEQSFEAMGYIAGQRPVVTRARKSIATFKVRQGMKLGCMVTLRGARMWEFLDRLVTVALPRTRDFRGISRKAFDGRGNYTLGVREILIFPEVNIEKLDAVPGMNICIHTTAKTDDEGRALLQQLGLPFRAA